MKTNRFVALLMLFTLIITASACKADKPKPAASDDAAGAKKDLVLAIGGEPETGFDPTTGWGRYGSPLFQSTLLKRDSNLNIVPDLADSYTVSADGLIWMVKLKSGIKFSDGEPLTAADVQYTFETAAKSGSSIDLSNLSRVMVEGDQVVTFMLKEPQSTFTQMLVATGIVPKHAHGKDYALKPVGSGPFKLVQWDKGQQLIVEANPDYYGTKPFFQKITFLFLNEDAAFAAAKAGTVDMAAIPAAFSKQSVSGMELAALPSADNRGIMFPYVKAGTKTADGNPIGNDVTADLSIRKAINMALDRKALVQGILEGHGTPAYTLNDGLPWFNPDAVIPDADMDGAKKLLAANGWLDTDKDGILEKGALKAQFNLLYPSNDVTRQSLAIAAADMLKPLGIQVKVEGKSWDEIGKQMHANAVLLGWGSHDPLEMYNVYSAKFGGVEYYNPGFYNNPAVEAYMTQALHSTNEKEAWEFWKKAQWDGTTGLSARGDAPWAWLVNLDHLYLVKSGLDIGKQKVHPHGHGWPVTDNIEGVAMETIKRSSSWATGRSKTVLSYILRKCLGLLLLLLAVSGVSFILVHYSPIDPIQAYVGADMMKVSPGQRQAIVEYWGLNDPAPTRYWNWISALASGDWGTSMIYRRPVLEVIGERFAASLAPMGAAWVLSGIIGFFCGILAAMNRNRWVDRLVRWYCYILSSTPTFWVGLLMMLVFAVWLGWLPVGLAVPAGVTADQVHLADRVRHMVLPILTLSVTGIASIALHTREKLLDVMDSEFWLFAKARGEQGLTIFWRHGLRNVALPAITLQFASFSELFGGAVLAEQVFSYPGLGQAAVEAGLRGDVPLLLGVVLCSAVFVYTGNTLADICYRLIDPRVKAGVRP